MEECAATQEELDEEEDSESEKELLENEVKEMGKKKCRGKKVKYMFCAKGV